MMAANPTASPSSTLDSGALAGRGLTEKHNYKRLRKIIILPAT